jgi:hypothetical protein
VLLAIGHDKDIEAEEEKKEILRRVHPAQCTVDIQTIIPKDRDELYGMINNFVPHVLHFIGHATSNPPHLEFQGWDWTNGQVAADVGGPNLDKWTPCLVFLNACRTGTASGGVAPMAGVFLVKGAKAAVAMQGDIKGKAAGVLAGVFYERLAGGTPINEAMLRARSAVARKYGYKEAAYPALTMRYPPAATLPLFQSPGNDYQKRIKSCDLLPKLAVFVNQLESRRSLYENFWPFLPKHFCEQFVLLRGDARSGKSVLSAWMLDLSLRLGRRVRYVKVSSEPSAAAPGAAAQLGVNHIRILELIWGINTSGQGSPLMDPLPPPSNGTALHALLEDAKKTKDPAVYGKFREALADVSKDRPVTIVLDEFQKAMDSGSFWILWENLFARLGDPELKNVFLMLVLGEDEYREYRIDDQLKQRPGLKIPKKEIKLKALAEKEFIELFSDYMYFRSKEFHDQRLKDVLKMTAESVAKNDNKPLSVARFEEKALEMAKLFELRIDE